jgi:ParB family chromosome partitioning protein
VTAVTAVTAAGPPWPRLVAEIEYATVPLAQIAPDPDQPRGSMSEERLQSLSVSLRAWGVIQPLVVSVHPDAAARAETPYMLIAGGRRWAAAARAELAAVPVVVRREALSAADRLMLQLAENDDDLAEPLSLFDRASGVARAHRLSGLSQAAFARQHRRSPAWMSEMLSLAQAEGTPREALQEGFLQGVLAARTYVRLGRYQQRSLLDEARRSGAPITLRRAETAAAHVQLRRAAGSTAGSTAAASLPPVQAAARAAPVQAAARIVAAAPPAGRGGEAGGGDTGGGSGGAAPPGSPAGGPRGPRGPWVVIEFTRQQFETLLILLGQEPADDAAAQTGQLLACL